MPKQSVLLSKAADAVVTRVTAALLEERRSIAVFLEGRHSALLADLSSQLCMDGFLRASASFPDLGPDVSLHETPPSVEYESSASGVAQPPRPQSKGVDFSKVAIVCSSDHTEKAETIPSTAAESTEVGKLGSLLSERQEVGKLGSLLSERQEVGNLGSMVSEHNHGGKGRASERGRVSGSKNKNTRQERFTRDVVIRRLTAKLGPISAAELLSADSLHSSMEGMSLLSYDLEQLRDLFSTLRIAMLPLFDSVDVATTGDEMSRISEQLKVQKKVSDNYKETLSNRMKEINRPSDHVTASARASWGNFRASRMNPEFAIPFHCFVDVLVMDSTETEEIFGPQVVSQLAPVKEILLSSDANCLIAELMHLRVDDISAPTMRASLQDSIEPVISVIIILNAILIGLQTVPEIANHPGTVAADIIILLFFLVEFVVKIRNTGLHEHFFGNDFGWNWFDFLIIVCAIFDIILGLVVDTMPGFGTSTMTIVRIIRLTRLARLARIFRLSWLRELMMVIKGLKGGLRTLFWAIVLLFVIIYIVGVLLTTTIGQSEILDDPELEAVRRQHFSSLTRSAFTTFRCLLIVECSADSGKPILVLTTERYGWIVPVCYMLLFVAVSVGIMNLITAIYIEMTLREAKKTDDTDKQTRHRESVRVAKALKLLLFKIITLQDGFRRSMTSQEVTDLMNRKSLYQLAKVGINVEADISKEVFLIAIQDQEVQQIMNDLDIPPERAHLFDVLDADGSGELKPAELLNGLLKVRGESRRSDSAGLFLAVRALQTQLNIMESTIGQLLDAFRSFSSY